MGTSETEIDRAESTPDGDSEAVQQDSKHPNAAGSGVSRRAQVVRVALVVYVVALFWFALKGRSPEPAVQVEDLLQLVDWAVGVLRDNALAGALFLGLGLLIGLSMEVPANDSSRLARFGKAAVGVLAAMGLFVLLSMARLGRPPAVISLILPSIGCAVGMWIGRTCLRGRRAVLWLVPKLGLLLLAFGLGAVAIVVAAIDDEPSAFESPEVTSAEKRRLAEVVKDPPRTAEGFSRIRLSERDVNLLLAMATPWVFPDGKAKLAMETGMLHGESSIRIPDKGPLRYLIAFGDSAGYVNVEATCNVEFHEERIDVDWKQFRVGRISVPRLLVADVWPILMSAMHRDEDLRQLMSSIGSVRIEPKFVEVTMKSRGLVDRVLPSLLTRLGRNPGVLPKVRVHYRHLVEAAKTMPADDRFGRCMQTAFAYARERSEREDPVLENRAAILALAIMHGHWRVENLVGRVSDEKSRRTARRHRGRVTLRNRGDWSKHFLVSAALALLSNEMLSDEAGLFKEELDAGEGGSGFSFADLLADRAGTLFALAATRDKKAARAMQQRLADGFEIDILFPEAADLPEGIPDQQLQDEYGGVGGEKYNEVIQEIERRLSECTALR